jgi:YD repeat-containing protein
MTIRYFEDTDTLNVAFRDAEVRETRDLDENTLVEYDAQGNLVSMTIEHARERVDLGSFSFQPVLAMKPVA